MGRDLARTTRHSQRLLQNGQRLTGPARPTEPTPLPQACGIIPIHGGPGAQGTPAHQRRASWLAGNEAQASTAGARAGAGWSRSLCLPGDGLGLVGKFHLLWRTLVSNFLHVIRDRCFKICL